MAPQKQRNQPSSDANVGEDRSLSDVFRHLAAKASEHFGSHWAFIAAVSLVLGWAASGPIFGFSEGWQLVINTTTTIITFLMVFIIQTTQNRDARAVHLKLDELIRATKARNIFADLEDASDEELEVFQREFEQLRKAGKHGAEAAAEARDRALSSADSDEEEDEDDPDSEGPGEPPARRRNAAPRRKRRKRKAGR